MKRKAMFLTLAPNDFRRMVWLIDTYRIAGALSFSELNERWMRSSVNPTGEPMNRSTFKRWKDVLFVQFGVDLFYSAKDGCRYHILNPEALEERTMANEMLKLMSIQVAMAQVVNGGSFFAMNLARGAEHVAVVADSIDQRRRISFRYGKNAKVGEEHRIKKVDLEPWCIKYYRERLYVMGVDIATNKVKTYGLDRMHEVVQTATAALMPPDEETIIAFRDAVGVTRKEVKAQRIIIKAYETLPDYLDSRPLHKSQSKGELDGDGIIYTYLLAPNMEFKQELMRESNELEIIEPSDLREELCQWARNYLKRNEAKAN